MFNDGLSLDALKVIAAAHARIGATSILPTLITETPEHVARAIEVVAAAIEEGVQGIAGLHIEGPHISKGRKGAHDKNLIRTMEPTDVALYKDAASRLPILKITLAPECVAMDQIRELADCGVLVSIGHTEATFDACVSAANAGARCVTHLFNAQSQLGNRDPGLVGAALHLGNLSAGLIADGVHVHPASMSLALRAKNGPGAIFLVSDSMATAGSDITDFLMNGRRVIRKGGCLTLEDGTLAGSDINLSTAIRNLVEMCDCPLDRALAMATSIPAAIIGRTSDIGSFMSGARADMVHLSSNFEIQSVWQAGQSIGR